MTTATATTEGQEDLTGTQEGIEEGRTPTESILTGQEGAEAADPQEVEDAIALGFKRARGNADKSDEEVVASNGSKQGTDEGNGSTEGQGTAAASASTSTTTQPDDPEIAGLGMKASEVKAQLARVATLEKSNASIAGSLGHLKQVVSSAGQGKKVSAEQLTRVTEEFGAEFASALASDLNSAGFGGGATVDTAAIQQMVEEKVAEARAASQREFEKKLVLRSYPDADDHFARPRVDANGQPVLQKDASGNDVPVWDKGPKYDAFMKYVQTMPAARQQELFGSGGWDSAVVGKALGEFKDHEKKVASQQTTQTQRMQRAAVPRGNGGEAVQPAVDPIMQGWSNVRGKRAAVPAGNGGRGR